MFFSSWFVQEAIVVQSESEKELLGVDFSLLSKSQDEKKKKYDQNEILCAEMRKRLCTQDQTADGERRTRWMKKKNCFLINWWFISSLYSSSILDESFNLESEVDSHSILCKFDGRCFSLPFIPHLEYRICICGHKISMFHIEQQRRKKINKFFSLSTRVEFICTFLHSHWIRTTSNTSTSNRVIIIRINTLLSGLKHFWVREKRNEAKNQKKKNRKRRRRLWIEHAAQAKHNPIWMHRMNHLGIQLLWRIFNSFHHLLIHLWIQSKWYNSSSKNMNPVRRIRARTLANSFLSFFCFRFSWTTI